MYYASSSSQPQKGCTMAYVPVQVMPTTQFQQVASWVATQQPQPSAIQPPAWNAAGPVQYLVAMSPAGMQLAAAAAAAAPMANPYPTQHMQVVQAPQAAAGCGAQMQATVPMTAAQSQHYSLVPQYKAAPLVGWNMVVGAATAAGGAATA
eukprot:Rhum_TRINITY_DN14583_c29_g1::Rhum_TRINITY_DN14583_c29_g1_i1::g.101390::m.101390